MRWRGLNVRLAFPGTLGYPAPPAGFVYLTDDNGYYLTDDDGVFLIAPENGP